MESIPRVQRPHIGRGAMLFAAHKQGGPTQIQNDKHTDLLHKIAEHFDFNANEAESLVQQTYADAGSGQGGMGISLPYQLWLSRILVRKCVFRISSELFLRSGCNAEKARPSSLNYYYRYRNAGELNLQRMPLSFRAVYILHQHIGFTTGEIADILNTTLFKVKERYHKAVAFLLSRHMQATPLD